MKIISEAHKYQLENMEGSEPQTIQFIEKALNESSGNFETVNDGTTNEEVLEVLINRISVLNEKMPCNENVLVLNNLGASLQILEQRTKDRIARKVEGTNNA